MAEVESEEAVRLRNKASEMFLRPCSTALPTSKDHKSSYILPQSVAEMGDEGSIRLQNQSSYVLTKSIAEMGDEDPIRLQNQSSYVLTKSIAEMGDEDPIKLQNQSSYVLTKSIAEMGDEDPIRLQNQSCAIREEIGKTMDGERLVYSSLAHLPTFSIGLSSTQGENPPPAALRESNVDPEEKSPHRYFQMPELGARVFIGDCDGFDTIACHLFGNAHHDCKFHLDSEYAVVRSLYNDDHPGGLSGWLRAHPGESWRSKVSSEVILSGTELFVGPFAGATTMVGNLGGKNSRVSGSSSNYKDFTGDQTIRQPLEIVDQPGAPVPGVWCCQILGVNLREPVSLTPHWEAIERPYLWRRLEGSYLKKPKFMKWNGSYDCPEGVLHLTRFDDFVILGNKYIVDFLAHEEITNIVRRNAFETADVIAAQLVKRANVMATQLVESAERQKSSLLRPITAIVIFLDHKEIGQREYENDTLKVLEEVKDHKSIAKSEEEEKKTTLKEDKQVFATEMEGNNEILMEEDHKVKIVVGEPLPNVPLISTVSLNENELGMKSTITNSNLTSMEVQNDFEASSSIVLVEDDCKSEDLKVSHYITKWIIYGDLLERTLLCFFNIEEMQYEFYFEDHESMATIIGLGLPHSKVVLECGSLQVIVVEILKEDWDIVWVHSNVIPCAIPKGNVLKQERFPNILHHIANIINSNNIVIKANNNGVGGDNGKDKAQGSSSDSKDKGKTQDHMDNGNIGLPSGGSHATPNDNDKRENDNKERKGEDGNDEEEDNHDRDDGKTSNNCKEVQAVVHLRLLPGGILEDKEKNKELGEGLQEEIKRGEIELGKIHEEEVEEKKTELEEVLEEVEEEKKKELGKGCNRVETKKKKHFEALWNALTRGKNGNVVRNHQKWPTTKGIENGDVDENLEKELVKQIHAQMVFTFTIKDETNGPLKTIQVTIDPITFQFPSNNEENYLQRHRFGWFHKKLQVAFGIVNTQVADLDAKSCKVLDSSDAKEVNLQGNSMGSARTRTNAYKVNVGIKHGVIASGEYDRTNGLEAKTTAEVHNSWETNKTLTKGGFSISEHTDLNIHQLKYSYRPHFPFNEKEFELRDEDNRLKVYENPICQLQRVSCEGTWHPYDSENLEAYKLEASRELGMTKIYDLDLETREEKQQKRVWKVGKNLPLCFIQKLEKLIYLNHAMSHLISSSTRVYRLKEQQGLSDSSTTFVTQAQNKREPEWPSDDPLVDVKL